LASTSSPARSASPPTAGDALTTSTNALFAKQCLLCHGEKRSGGLDLRTRDGALKGGAHGAAITPGKPEKTLLLRYLAGDGVPQMPPGKPLPATERELIRKWIASGASWPSGGKGGGTWWSLRPLQRPASPVVRQKGWVRNPIDAFVLAKLEEKGLSPAPTADRPTLIRRLYFDLTGLPPTPEEVQQFTNDRSPQAYEKLVDRLLASPRYGERWARHWLDGARFAESQGFERDKIRDNAWRYRDWVIRAFNQDLPYDRFVQYQVAGDVLPDASRDSVIATGFLVAGPWDEVGAQQVSEVMKARVREDELEDIVSAVGQTFLGLSVNCARCHDHKFDPIPQKDYYAFQAVFAGVRHGDRSILPPAEAAARDAEIKAARGRVEALTAEIAKLELTGRQRVVAARRSEQDQAGGEPPVPPAFRWTFESDARDAVAGVELALSGGASISGGRLRLDGKDDRALSAPLPLALSAKTLEAWVSLGDLDQRGGSALTVEAEGGGVFDGLVFGEREPKKWVSGSEGFVRTRDLGAPLETSAPADLVHVAATYSPDGRITFYRNGKAYGEGYVPATGASGGLRTFAAATSRVLLGHRHTGSAAAAWLKGEIEEARVYSRALTADEIAVSFKSGPGVVVILPEQALAALTTEERARRSSVESQIPAAREQLKKLEDIPKVYGANPVKAPEVFLLLRGDVQKKGDKVVPSALSCVPEVPGSFGLPADAPDGARRLKLAQWLTDRANPLTPRVMANRVWQYHFGRGLVASTSDFGANGEQPTHPALLDLLGAELRDSGWSVKHLHRLIVTSNTYKQSGRFDPKAAAMDGENTLLWRRSPRRMDAEELRDAMLLVSGQLNLQEGGPGFRPFSVVQSNTHFYTYEDRIGPEYNRRSIYRTVVNSSAVPLLEAFDCPDPSVKTPRRATTTTPMQSLALLNNSFVLRQSRELAARLKTQGGGDTRRAVDLAYRGVFGRPPTTAETDRAVSFAGTHGLPALCRVLFNASEFVYVR